MTGAASTAAVRPTPPADREFAEELSQRELSFCGRGVTFESPVSQRLAKGVLFCKRDSNHQLLSEAVNRANAFHARSSLLREDDGAGALPLRPETARARES